LTAAAPAAPQDYRLRILEVDKFAASKSLQARAPGSAARHL